MLKNVLKKIVKNYNIYINCDIIWHYKNPHLYNTILLVDNYIFIKLYIFKLFFIIKICFCYKIKKNK
jgi:hypothetical protein